MTFLLSFSRVVIDHVWQSTLFAAAAALLTLALRSNRAAVRHAVWMAASLKFLVPFAVFVELGHRLEWRAAAPPPAPVMIVLDVLSQPFSSSTTDVAPAATSTLNGIAGVLPALLAAVWIIGVAVVLLIWCLRWRRVAAAVRDTSPAIEGRELDVLRRLERTVGIGQPIDLVLSEGRLEPGVFGIGRPVLVWPRRISEHLTGRQIEAILAHEVAHVRRRDNLAALLHMLVEATFWFHPLVWWLGARLIDERERACDEEVLRLGNEPQVYAEGILKTCELYVESPVVCVAGVTGFDLEKRVVRIMSRPGGASLSSWRKLLLFAAGCAAVAGPIAIGIATAPRLKAQARVEVTRIEQAAADIRSQAELLTQTVSPGPKSFVHILVRRADSHPMSITFVNGQLKDLLRMVAKPAGIDVSFDPAVADRKTTVRLDDVTMMEALDRIAAIHHLSYTFVTGNSVLIKPGPSAQGERPSFETASVNKNTAGDFRVTVQVLPGGRFAATNMSARALIRYAYQLQDFELAGGPDWLTSDRFDVAAKADGNASPDQLRLMLRTLLTERFGLAAHRETRDLPLYALRVSRRDGRPGAQLRPSDADCSNAATLVAGPHESDQPPRCGFVGPASGIPLSSGRGNLAFRGLTMGTFARWLAPLVHRGVVDRTGLVGYFDGDFDLTAELGPPPPPPGLPDPFDRQSFPSIFTVLSEQLGLKLDSERGPVDVLVIDRAGQPTPD